MRPTGVALPSFLKARQVLAGWGDALKSRDVLRLSPRRRPRPYWCCRRRRYSRSQVPAPASQPLPSVVVTSPEKRAAATTTRRTRRPAVQSAAAPRRPQPKREARDRRRESARRGPGLRRRPFDGGHQDQHADHADAAVAFGDRQRTDPRPEARQVRRDPALHAGRCRRNIRRRHAQRLVPDPRLQVRRCRPVPRRPAALLHVLCELEAAAVQPGPGRGAARSLGRAVWRLQPERHRQRGQQDAAGGADPLHRDRRQQFRQCLSVVRFRRPGRDRSRKRQAVLPRGRPGPERRHPGRFHARQQLFHRTIRHLQAGRGHHLHRAGVSLEDRYPRHQLPALYGNGR